VKRFIVLCGPSHSGKSTFAKRFKNHFTIISSDQIRKTLTGSYAISEKDDLVWEEFAARKDRALRKGKNIILDACHLSKRARRHALEGVDERYIKTCFAFDCPFPVIKKRCLKEGRMPVSKVRIIWLKFQKPTLRELKKLGFDEVYFLENYKEVKR